MSFIAPQASPIDAAERRQRIENLAGRLQTQGVAALLLGSTTSLRYFTGLDWHASEWTMSVRGSSWTRSEG